MLPFVFCLFRLILDDGIQSILFTGKKIEVGVNYDIKLLVKPRSADGVIFSVAKNKDYFFLTMVEGKVRLYKGELNPNRGFIKGRALGKLTGCEDGFARLLLASMQL